MTDAEAPILWPPDANSQLIGKDRDAREVWRKKEKMATEDKMVGWHHQCNGHELGKTPGDEKDAWCARVHGVANSRAQLGNWTTWLKVVQTPTHWNIPWDLFWKEVCIDQQKAVETETIICAPSSVQHLIKQRGYQAAWGSPTPEYWNSSPMVVLMLMNTVVHLKMLNHHLP